MNKLVYSRCAIGKGHARVDDELRVVKVEFLHCLAVATASLYCVVDVFRTIKERYAPPTKTNKVLSQNNLVNPKYGAFYTKCILAHSQKAFG